MPSTAKITATLAALALTVTALAGCTATEAKPAAEKPAAVKTTPAETPASEEPAEEPDDDEQPDDAASCPTARINLPNYAYNTEEVTAPELSGELVDGGPREFATGDPTLKDGQIVSYTVRAGDTASAVAARFCMDARSFAAFNHTDGWDLKPGDTLILRPDPSVAWEWED